MLAYSPRKNRAKVIAEYSTKKPATSSDSPSGRSKGERLVSASVETKKITNIGSMGSQNQLNSPYLPCCASTMSERIREPTRSRQERMTNRLAPPVDTHCAPPPQPPR